MSASNWVYLQAEQRLYTVGFFDAGGNWHPDSDHADRKAAGDRCNYLNGGMDAAQGLKMLQEELVVECLRTIRNITRKAMVEDDALDFGQTCALNEMVVACLTQVGKGGEQ